MKLSRKKCMTDHEKFADRAPPDACDAANKSDRPVTIYLRIRDQPGEDSGGLRSGAETSKCDTFQGGKHGCPRVRAWILLTMCAY